MERDNLTIDQADIDLDATSAYQYVLPEERIATFPADPPDSSRLLLLEPDGTCSDRIFSDFPSLVTSNDVLVINETRVIRARIRGRREPGGGAAEILILRPLRSPIFDPNEREWYAFVRPGRRLRVGQSVRFGDAGRATIVDVCDDGTRIVRFDLTVSFDVLLETYAELPLPPYVGAGNAERARRYQTMFARVPGSVAAPTASLHFTQRTFDDLRERGVTIAPLVLHVGAGTFVPVSSERLTEHRMHTEYYAISAETCAAIATARSRGGRVIAAGTTVMRALEGAAQQHNGELRAGEGETSIFIRPGYRFAVVDALLTNFHLPQSTLLALVAAFAGYERTREAYRVAIERGYRFYSFGDAMFIGQR